MGIENPERNPPKDQIFKGNTVDILDREGKKLGRAILIERCPSKFVQDNLPYVKSERQQGEKKAREKYGYIWSYERWKVEWIEHSYYRKGMTNCVEVNYYIDTCAQYRSGYDINFGQEGVVNKYIFLEEEGVMVSPKGDYHPQAVKALNRICRSFGGELVVYTHNRSRVREHFELHGIRKRILAFLDPPTSFAKAIKDYVERVDAEDFIILAGESVVKHSRTHQIDPEIGLRINPKAPKKEVEKDTHKFKKEVEEDMKKDMERKNKELSFLRGQ